MPLFVKLIVIAIVLVAIVMGVFGLKLLSDKSSKFNVETDNEKYKKMKEEGIYSVYKKENEQSEDKKDS